MIMREPGEPPDMQSAVGRRSAGFFTGRVLRDSATQSHLACAPATTRHGRVPLAGRQVTQDQKCSGQSSL